MWIVIFLCAILILLAVRHFRSRSTSKRMSRVSPRFSSHNQKGDLDSSADYSISSADIPMTDSSSIQRSVVSSSESIIEFLYLIAPPGASYAGYELLQALLASGLRYGKKRIFHRHSDSNGRGPVLFSLASMSEPGVFDIANIGACQCAGLVLFMNVFDTEDARRIFDCMYDTGLSLIEELGGEVHDCHHQKMTADSLKNARMRVSSLSDNTEEMMQSASERTEL